MKKGYLLLVLGLVLIVSGASTYLYNTKVKGKEVTRLVRSESTGSSHSEETERHSDDGSDHDQESAENQENGDHDAEEGGHENNHDGAEEQDVDSLVEQSSGRTKEAYQFAAERPDILEFLPCFCGCVTSGHKSNKDCFIKKMGQKGQVVYDQHGLFCGACVDVAMGAKEMLAQGKSLKEIREAIDAKYKDYEGTATPKPQ